MVCTLKPKPLPSPSSQSTSSSAASKMDRLSREEERPVIFSAGPTFKAFHLPPRRQRRVRKSNSKRKRKEKHESEEQSASTTPDALNVSAEPQNILPPKHGLDTLPSRFIQPSIPEQPDESLVTPPGSSQNQTSEDEPAATDGEANALFRECLIHSFGGHEGRDPCGLASFPYLYLETPLPWPRCTSCEEKMPWLVNAVYNENGRHDDIGRGAR